MLGDICAWLLFAIYYLSLYPVVKVQCCHAVACSGVGTLPGLRDILFRSSFLRCFPCQWIPFRTVIHFLGTAHRLTTISLHENAILGILREFYFRAIFHFKIAFLQFSYIMGNRKGRYCVWLYPDRGFLICAMAIISQKQLAKKICLSASQLSRIVSGETKTVSSDILIGVAKEFKVSADYILV